MTVPFTDLDGLAAHLRDLAGTHQPIVLDTTILAPALAGALATGFAVPDGQHLTVTGVATNDIGGPIDGVLTISAGSGSVLALDGVRLGLRFWMTDGGLELSVVATMPGGWTFTDSLPGLALFPFDSVAVHEALFVFSSVAQTAFDWPSDAGSTVDLAAGQNLLCQVGLGGVPLVATVLGEVVGTDVTVRLCGPFAPTAGQVLPVGTLTAHVDSATFSIGAAPNDLSLTNPRVAIQVDTADHGTNPVQEVDLLVLGTFQSALEVSVSIPMSGRRFEVSAAALPGQGSVANLIEHLPGGASFATYIPPEFAAVFDEFGLNWFTMFVDLTPAVTYLGLSIGTQKPWPGDMTNHGDPGSFTLENLALVVEAVDPAGLNWISVKIVADVEFLPHIFAGPFDFTVQLVKQDSWAVGTISGRYGGVVNLGDLVAGLLGHDGSVPQALRGISLSDFGVVATRAGAGQPFDYTAFGTGTAVLPLLDTTLGAVVTAVFAKTATGHSVELTGAMTIGGETLTLDLDLGTSGSLLHASWTSTGNPLDLADIADAFGFGPLPPLPPGLDFGLSNLQFAYDITRGALALTATTAGGSNLVLVSAKTAGADQQPVRHTAFALDLRLGIKLADLPLVGDKLPDADQLGIPDLGCWVLSGPMTRTDAAALNSLIPNGYPTLPETDLDARVLLFGQLSLGTDQVPLQLVLGSAEQEDARGQRQLLRASGSSAAPLAADATKWFPVNRTFGVFSFQRIGVQYSADGGASLVFLLDASIALGPLAFSAQGLGIGTPLTHFAPTFHLSGLGLSYAAPPVSITGALYALPASQLGDGVSYQYDGLAVVAAQQFGLAAIGSYAKMTDGEPSLFVFAQLRAPLGGPPAFFVTGLMGGFGYNRSLTLPAPDQVLDFPLLALGAPNNGQQAPARDPAQVLRILEGAEAPANGPAKAWIAPKSGEYWLAAGLEFTSFELVTTQAIVVVEFGDDFTIALLGLSTLRLPQQAPDAETYAYVELELEAVLKPVDGFFGVTAILSPNSYVLAPAAKLTGGFAFNLWFGDNPYAGQFVITLGGYHPAFAPPSFFPQVPRVGLIWAVSDLVSIKGGGYFALTTSCVMAGGELEATFTSGALRAWFTAQADLLMTWHPFTFLVDMAASIGVSYTLDILGIAKTLSASVSATLHLWGPPTGGTVTVHLYFISFTVDFGASRGGPADLPLTATEFAGLLPANPVKISVTGGLTSTVDGSGQGTTADDTKVWIVRTGGFSFRTESSLPASTVALAESADGPGTPLGQHAIVNVRPMNLRETDSTHTVRVRNITDGQWCDLSAWSPAIHSRSMPASLWGEPLTDAHGEFTQAPGRPSADVVADAPVGATLSLPSPRLGALVGPVPLGEIAAEPVSVTGESPLSPAPTASGDYLPAPDTGSIGRIAMIADAPAAGARAALRAALAGAGLDSGGAGSMTVLAANVTHLFADAPLVVTL